MPKNKNRSKNKGKHSKGPEFKKINKNRTNRPKMGKINKTKPKAPKTNILKSETSLKAKKERKRKSHPKLVMAFKIFIVIFLLCSVIGAGIIAGLLFGLFGDDFEISKEELTIKEANSIVVDKNGAVIANLSGDEKRKIISLEDMAPYLPKAYVAIEDERFYKHHGVDIKRTTGAIIKKIFGNGSYGGSTITQQLVKNITQDDETQGLAGIARKVKEWAKACQVERMISKQQILELYLNILYVGGEGNLHGVELGAEYYFNKSAKDLNLAECAFLAGINSSPNNYNPYKEYKNEEDAKKRDERIKKKIVTVLGKMKELGYIEKQEDYDEAVKQAEEGLKFEKAVGSSGNINSYHTDAVVEQVVEQVMEQKHMKRQIAENYVYSGGLTIYSTVDPKIQSRIDEEYKKEKYTKQMALPHDKDKDGKLKNEHAQSGMAIIDFKTGQVLGIAGGLGEKKAQGWNRATHMKKQTGSAIKIIADVAPALEEKIITPATVYMDEETAFNNGTYKPKNDGRQYDRKPMGIRRFIKLSRNIPAVKIMAELKPETAIKYLKDMGLKSIDDKHDNVLALAIGGMTTGASPLEMAAAYGTIANDGEYIEPTFYTKVVDKSGKTVMEPDQEKKKVFSKQTAYLTKSIAQEPVFGGTASYCAIPGMNVAAKTGTTDKSYDRWLAGFTPYYAAATWYGFDSSEEVKYRGRNPAGQLWSTIMKDIHKGLPEASFERPEGIVEKAVCRETGCLATDRCYNKYTEIFSANNLPEKCPGHGAQKICTISNKQATEFCEQYCPVKTVTYGRTLPKEKLKLWKPLNRSQFDDGKIDEICDVHTKPKEEVEDKKSEEDKKTGENEKTEEGKKPEIKPEEGKKPEPKPDDGKEPKPEEDKKPGKK